MKEEILDIAKKLYHNHLTPETATNLLLDLFAGSNSVFFNQLKNTNMITTVDGVVKKRGEIIYELAYYKGYIPLKSIVHVSVQNELHAYSTLDLCQKECDRRNKLRTS